MIRKQLTFPFEMKNGDDFDRYDTSVIVNYDYDDYGSDMDGNRGEKIKVINEVKILGVLDSDGNLIDPVPQNIVNVIEAMVGEKI